MTTFEGASRHLQSSAWRTACSAWRDDPSAISRTRSDTITCVHSAGKAGVSSLFRTPSVAALRPAARFARRSFPRPPRYRLAPATSRSGNSGFHRSVWTALELPAARSNSVRSGAGGPPSGEGSDERPSSLLLRLPRQAVSCSRWVDPGPAERPVSRPGVLVGFSYIASEATGVRCLC